MKFFTLIIPLLLFTTLSSSLIAGDVDIKWEHPKKYTDIFPNSSSNRKKYRQHVMQALSTHLDKLASEKLPSGYHLKITVLDIDLAGYIDFDRGYSQRIVREVDFPRIKLVYQLIKDQKVIRESKADLKDMNFLRHINSKFKNTESFYYEKRLLSDWFNQSIVPLTK